MQRLVMLIGLVLVACSDTATVDDACRNVCSCEVFPAEQRLCETACVTRIEARPVPVSCLDCLAGVTCEDAVDSCAYFCDEETDL